MVKGRSLPSLWIDVRFAFLMGRNLVVSMRRAGRIDYACIVPAVGQHEGDIRVCQHLYFVNGLPWRYMIGDRADRKYGNMNIAQ